MKILNYKNKFFFNLLNAHLLKRYKKNNETIDKIVKKILKDVELNGDSSIIKYTKEFDKINVPVENIRLSKKILKSYKNQIDKKVFNSFRKAIKNVKRFHKLQIPNNYISKERGVKLISKWNALDSVGLYIPGGNAVYPSSIIMNVIPAILAGVKRIVCVTPPTKYINPYLLAILDELNIEEVYQIGGAQAIGALAYGTKTIKPVNKIFGPGNAFVSSAKKQLFGKVGIDLIAGPSEIVVIADNNNNPRWVASDLIAQAEHDINTQCILITKNLSFAKSVIKNINELKKSLSKKNIIEKSLKINGLVIIVDKIYNSADIVNIIAPEHLHIHISRKEKLIKNIKNAGSIFIGEYSIEAFGDYIIGTNHILPTFGSAKYSSCLNVLDFMKRNSMIEINKFGYKKYYKDVERIASIEELDAHKLSVKIRQNK